METLGQIGSIILSILKKIFINLLLISFCNIHGVQVGNTKQTVLVTGGAGYIGSHTAWLLAQQGYNVVILDKFIYDQPFNHAWAHIVRGDCADQQVLGAIFTQYHVDAVIHFSGFIAVGESVQNPLKYYENNVGKTVELLRCMRKHGVNTFIFSSSAAVYGIPNQIPILEDHATLPINPYGRTKLIIEQVLQDCAHAHGLKFVALRYFNACGAQPEEGLGEFHKPETHLIPLALRAVMENTTFNVFGDDYQTADGTCVRDYLHVRDLATAHVQALQYLQQGGASDVFNLGTGTGYSVKQVLDMISSVCGNKIKYVVQARRAGDPAVLVADARKAERVLNWKAQYSDLQKIVESAYKGELSKRS